MYVYTFADVGNVWADAFEVNPVELNASVGVGMQLKVLPVRLEYGYPILTEWDHLEGNSGRIHFNIGLSF
jgi:outer membrane protein assembly factor BamA